MVLKFLLRWFAKPRLETSDQPTHPTQPSQQSVRLGPDTLHQVLKRGPVPAGELVWCLVRLCAYFDTTTSPLRSLSAKAIGFTTAGEPVVLRRHPDGSANSLSSLTPEIVLGHRPDARSVVFMLAQVLFEAISGLRLFAGDSDFERLQRVRDALVPPRPAAIESRLYQVLQRALQADPERRYNSPAEFAQALAPFSTPGAAEAFTARLSASQPPAPRTPPTPANEEARLVAMLDAGQEPARLIYADWLEEWGRTNEAQWLRLECRLQTLPRTQQRDALAELRALKVSDGFLARVSRPAVEGCPIRLGLICPRTWAGLTRTADDSVRFCDSCQTEVHYCRTTEEARAFAAQRACIALDPTLVRTRDDLRPEAVVGRSVSPDDFDTLRTFDEPP